MESTTTSNIKPDFKIKFNNTKERIWALEVVNFLWYNKCVTNDNDIIRRYTLKNILVRTALKENAVHQWQLAEALGVNESVFSRRMRHEMPAEEQARLITIICNIAAKKEA